MRIASACKLAVAALALCLFSAGALAKTLPLPDSLVGLNSEAGETLLLHSTARQAYWNLSLHFVTQKTQAFCGIASIVMVLNALGAPAPTTPELEPYRIFTQDNFFNDETEKILPQTVLAKQGTTLDQIGHLSNPMASGPRPITPVTRRWTISAGWRGNIWPSRMGM